MLEKYTIDYSKPGIVFIFANSANLENLPNVDKDIESIEQTFGNLGYKIKKVNQVSSKEIEQHLVKIKSELFADNSCVFVFIESHGDTDKVYGNDGKTVSLSQFFDAFGQNKSLEGKPILFFIDACRFKNSSHLTSIFFDDFFSKKETKPKADFLIGFATVENFESLMENIESQYFQKLCKLVKESDEEIVFILEKIKNSINNQQEFITLRANLKHNLKKKLYLKNESNPQKSDLQNVECSFSIEDSLVSVYCIHLIDTNRLASGSRDKTIKIWNIDNYTCTHILEGHEDWVVTLLSLNRNTLISGSRDTTIKIWDMNNFTLVNTLRGHTESVTSFIIINNNTLASGSRDKTIKIWNLDNYTCINTLEGHIYWVTCFQLKNSNTLISGSADSTIKSWNLKEFKCMNTLKGHTLSVNCLQIIDENKIASGSGDTTIKIWNLKNWNCICTLEDHTFSVLCFQLFDMNTIVSGSSDNTIKIWNLEKGTCIKTLEGHTSEITDLQLIDKKSFVLASASLFCSIKFWKIAIQ